jgi:glycosyltransferase involved in cell wall biosynthesis
MIERRPLLSIIMPVYNHETLVGRAIRSCLEQSYGDFEIVAVDDGSKDDSAAVIASFKDPRVRLVRHETNRGVCPARNTAMANARGEWFVFFDSDDELLPGALATIHRRALAAPPDVGVLRFMCIDERGTSPDPPHDNSIWDYEAYLRWFERSFRRRQEALPCMRSFFYPEVCFPDDRSSEHLFHLELLHRTNAQACPEIVRRYHHHLGERITAPSLGRSMLIAVDIARNNKVVRAMHGEALRRFAPAAYQAFISGAATAAFLSGERAEGVRFSFEVLRLRPLAGRTWIILVFGLTGRYPLLLVQWLNRETRRRLENLSRHFRRVKLPGTSP